MFAAASAMNAKVLFNGTFTTSSSSSPVTSATRTVTRGGTIKFDSVFTDSGTPQYSKNAGAFTNITEGGTLVLAVGDTLAVRATLPTLGFVANFNIRRSYGGQLTEFVQLNKT